MLFVINIDHRSDLAGGILRFCGDSKIVRHGFGVDGTVDPDFALSASGGASSQAKCASWPKRPEDDGRHLFAVLLRFARKFA